MLSYLIATVPFLFFQLKRRKRKEQKLKENLKIQMNVRAVIVSTVVLPTTKMTKNGQGTKLKGEFPVTKPNICR